MSLKKHPKQEASSSSSNAVTVTQEKKTQQHSSLLETPNNPTLGQSLLKAAFLSIVIALAMVLITAIIIGSFLFGRAQLYLKNSGLSYLEVKHILQTGISTPPKAENGITTILVLGLDTLETRPGSPQLSDTMLLVFVNYSQGTITTLPLPRDIWSTEYQTKINALYHYGNERYPEKPEQFPTEVIESMTGTTINYTLVLTLEQVKTLIDMIGGITVDVPVAFTDESFPRTDVDVTVETDPAVLYETVSFDAGPQLLSGERALQYIRSRKSIDTEGTDIARGSRQQLVTQSLISQLQSKDVLTDPVLLGTLTRYYLDTFAEDISLTSALSIVSKLMKEAPTIKLISKSIPIQPEDSAGVLSNPPLSKYNVWVYEITDSQAFKAFITSIW